MNYDMKLHQMNPNAMCFYMGRMVKHFKGGIYTIKSVSKNADNPGESLVTYQALYGTGELWTRKLDDFVSKVPEGRESNQEYRFMLVELIQKL